MIVKFRTAETADIKAMKQLFKETIASVCKDIKTISGDISITARGFFEKNGFEVIKEQQNFRNNSCLINYKMVKKLS